MSIFTKLNRIITLRNGIRSRLNTLGVVTTSAKLETCKIALDNMSDNTKKTTPSNPIKGTFYSGTTQKIYARTGEGYCSSNTLMEVPVTNLISSNIKSGVAVGGVVGTYDGLYINGGTATVFLYDHRTSNYGIVYDIEGALFSGSIDNSGKTVTVNFRGNMIYVGTGSMQLSSYSGCSLVYEGGGAIFKATSNTVKINTK